MAQKTYEDNHFSESLLHLRRSIQLRPQHIESRLLIAKVLLKLGKAQEAEQHLDVAFTLGIPLNQIIIWQGMVLVKQEKYDEALKKLNAVHDKIFNELSSTDQAMLYALMGQVKMAKGKLNESLDFFNLAITRTPVRDKKKVLSH